MNTTASSRRPALRLVTSTLRPAAHATDAPEWRRVATAVLSCTRELARHLMQQRWGRVDEAVAERRELLSLMKHMPLDVDGRRCLKSLEQAARESDAAIAAMAGRRKGG
jgi:hypothetical protein